LEKDFEKHDGKLNEFIISAINKIYTSPTKHIFKYTKEEDNLFSIKTLEKFAKIISKNKQ